MRQFTAGRAGDAIKAADFARFALRRLARSRPGDDPASALAILAAAGTQAPGRAARPGRPPPGRRARRHRPARQAARHPVGAAARAARPRGQRRPVRGRLAARAAGAPPRHRHVTLARGPGLVSDGAEVPLVARLYDDVTVLADGAATAEKVLYALDGAWLAHIAAHGIFRADSPLFSSLRMHDGPLTVYDFERLQPRAVPAGPVQLRLRRAGPGRRRRAARPGQQPAAAGHGRDHRRVVPLNDQAVVPLMVDLHRHLRAGQTLAESVYHVRREAARRSRPAGHRDVPGRPGRRPDRRSQRDPPGQHVGAVLGPAPQPERAGRDGLTAKQPISSTGERGHAGPGLRSPASRPAAG